MDEAIVNGLRYSTRTADLIASDLHENLPDKNYVVAELYRTKKGRFFVRYVTYMEDQRDRIVPLSVDDAMKLYSVLETQDFGYEEAFGVEVEDA